MFPMIVSANKHLLPVYDKPLVYYPWTTLMLASVTEILLITNSRHVAAFRNLLGDGSDLGISITHAEQQRAGGISEALLMAETFVDGDTFALILGDNIFFGHGIADLLHEAFDAAADGASLTVHRVADPERYGVLVTDADGKPCDIVEKPTEPVSNQAVTGLYFFAGDAIAIARGLTPSARGELEITDLNRVFLQQDRLHVFELTRGFAWFDAGTAASLAQAAGYVEILQGRQSTGVAFPEEVAYRIGLIDLARLDAVTARMPECRYHAYLRGIVREETARRSREGSV